MLWRKKSQCCIYYIKAVYESKQRDSSMTLVEYYFCRMNMFQIPVEWNIGEASLL